MRKILSTILFTAVLLVVTPVKAQLKLGVKGGLNITEMSFSAGTLDKSNRTGFFIGPTVKFSIPIVGLGIDVAALYDQRDSKIEDNSVSEKYVNIPINLRYNIGLGDLASVFFAAGPQFGFNIGSKTFDISSLANAQTTADQYKMKDSQFSINVGAGVALINHLEVGATYNIVCGKTGDVTYTSAVGSISEQIVKTNRTNAWQIYAAYYF
jgi:hypothetical protein